MLQIRPAQWQALSVAAESGYLTRLTDFLRQEFPAACEIPLKEFKGQVGQQVAKAKSYGLQMEDEVATYAVTAWQLGGDFDTAFPAAEHMLNSPEYTPEQKRDWLAAWTVTLFHELESGD